MEQYITTSFIEIEPEYLHREIEAVIIERLRTKFCNKCSQKQGYIFDISPIIKILSNQMSRVSMNIVFEVQFTAECFKPEEGKEIEAQIKMLFEHGIIAEKYGMKILIPKGSITGKIKDGILKMDKREIRANDTIRIRLTTVKYDKKNFSAIGNII